MRGSFAPPVPPAGEPLVSRLCELFAPLRIAPGAQKPSEIALAPDIGQWTVRVTRLFKGRELQRVAFTVEE